MTPRGKTTIPIAETDERQENPPSHIGWIKNDVGDEQVEESTTPASPKQQTGISSDKISVTFSLVHGDILVFFGDEFEAGGF